VERASAPSSGERERLLVLLDPGHGGEDLGSPGPFGLWEGKLTLDISRRVRAWLAQLVPHAHVRLTRESDVFLTLEERAAMANLLAADLFVSVHLNAATTLVDKGGVATYVLDVNNDRNVLRLAARENGTRTTDVSPMQFLVGSLARSEQRARSGRLAELVQRGTLASARRFLPGLADRGVKSAMFYVLVGAQMPAILVEGSFITQPDEAAQLTTHAYRDALAEGIARGIARYLAEK
jgi:N-acetylmuramoyl-L-alanine amidase